MLGKRIIDLPTYYSDASIDVSKLEKGIYFIEIKTPKGIVVRKIIKQ